MPDVKGKKFPYTPEGEAAAAEYAQKTGAPFQMRAKRYNNSPMQKNWGDQLAINKKLDKDNMQGGLTGQPSGKTGKLGYGPIMKKTKGNMGAISQLGGVGGKHSSIGLFKNFNKTTNPAIQKTAKTIGGNIKTGVDKFAKSVGLKKRTGSIGDKMKLKHSSKAKRQNLVPKSGESQFQFKTRTRKSMPKVKTTGFKTYGYDSTTKSTPTAPKSKPYVKPKSSVKVKPASFGDAFKTARKAHGGDGGTFTFQGKKYSTNVKKKNKVVKKFKNIKFPGPKPPKNTQKFKQGKITGNEDYRTVL